jgi:small ligand-binding sensory domain FIST
MLEAGLGISTLPDPRAAGREASALALARLGAEPPGLSLVMATAAHGSSLSELALTIGRRLGGPDRIVVASVEGLVAPGVEVASLPAVSVLALAGLEVQPFLIQDLERREGSAGPEIASLAGGALRGEDLVVFFADVPPLRAGPLLDGLRDELAPATLLGTVAAPVSRGPAFLWHAGESARAALVGMVVRPRRAPRVAITQSCRPVSTLLTVTRARGNWVLGLDGRPALQVYEESAQRHRLGNGGNEPALLVGLREGESAGNGHAPRVGDLRVRNLVGFDVRRAGFCVPEPVPVGARLALLVRDPEAARGELEQQLAGLACSSPAFGLYFNCRARGHALFGAADVEATAFANAFADHPISGALGPCQFAPLRAGGPAELLTYAGALALVDR